MKQLDRRRHAVAGRVQLYTLLGAGAVTFGVGAALTVGSGVAQADSSNGGNRSASSAAEGRTQSPIRLNAKASRVQSTVVQSKPESPENPIPVAATMSESLLKRSHSSEIRAAASDHAASDATDKAGRSSTQAIESHSKAFVAAFPPETASSRYVAVEPTAVVSRGASATSALTPKDNVDIAFSGLNGSVGWIPFVGTAINGVKFALDSVSLAASVVTLDLPQAITELGNLFVDIIGLVPVVGAPVASLLSQTVLGVNVKLGILVQEGLQSFFVGESTWSQYQFNVDTVDVSIGLGGSQAGTATVSKPNYSGVPVTVDVINSGFQVGWSVPLEGRLQLLALAFS